MNNVRTPLLAAVCVPVALFACSGREPTGLRPPTEPLYSHVPGVAGVRISQVYGGGGNSGATLRNDFIELFNASASPVTVTGWSVQYASTAGTNWQKTDLSGTIPAGGYYLVQQAAGAGGSVSLPTPDATGSIAMSATAGKVALVHNNTTISTGTACPVGVTVVDFVGYGSGTTCSKGSPTAGLSNTTAAIREGAGCIDTGNNADDFATGAPAPRNTSAPAIDCPPSVVSTVPARGAEGVDVDANVEISFSEPVTVTGNWFSITCTSGSREAVVSPASGAAASFTLDPTENFAVNDACTVTVRANQVTGDGTPPATMAADYSWTFTTSNPCELPFTRIPDIQGTGISATIIGEVATRGVVIGDYEGPGPALRGFYVQDVEGDGNASTSDAIFVFNGDNNSVALGDLVRVTGWAEEFQAQTQIGENDDGTVRVRVVKCGTGTVTPAEVSLPFSAENDPERFEGMLVRLSQTLHVTEHFQLGRFGQVVLSSGGRLVQPTSVVAPGSAAAAMEAANNNNRIILDDAVNSQNPDPIIFGGGGSALTAANPLRGGDLVTGIVGVMTYTWAGNSASGNAFRVRPVGALGGSVPTFVAANPRPAAPDAVGGSVKVAAMNVLNYFNSFGNTCRNGVGGTTTGCRGASSTDEFNRQWPKTVAAIVGTGADVIGINEIENDGYDSQSSIAHLVGKLNEATAPGTYAFIDADAATGQTNALGTDAIKVALIYKPSRVTPTGRTAVLNTASFVTGGDGFPRNRPAIAQAFMQPNRARFIVSVNHLKSKGSACDAPDVGDGQGNCNLVRRNAARELADWLESDPTDTGDPDVLIMGDLNSYAQEDPITALTGRGYTNLISQKLGPNAYSYVFDGQWGYLDHALASPSIASQVTGVTDWHINADEPSVLDYTLDFKSPGQRVSLYASDQYRIADHDPVIVGLDLRPPPVSFDFRGFFWPVKNPPAYTEIKAGLPVPIMFRLGGNRGLNIFAPGYPAWRPISCETGAVEGGLTPTQTVGKTRLSYHRGIDTYVYLWDTHKTWANSCRELVVRFVDERQHTARFRFVQRMIVADFDR